MTTTYTTKLSDDVKQHRICSSPTIGEMADKILENIEEAGMLPPDRNHYNEEYGPWQYIRKLFG